MEEEEEEEKEEGRSEGVREEGDGDLKINEGRIGGEIIH